MKITITNDERNLLLDYFKNNENNTVRKMAKHFNFSELKVHRILNEYFNNLKINKK